MKIAHQNNSIEKYSRLIAQLTNFAVPSELMGKENYNLVFEGIDTIGQVRVNDDVTVNVDNMFVRYVIPFKPQAVSRVTMLFIKIQPPNICRPTL